MSTVKWTEDVEFRKQHEEVEHYTWDFTDWLEGATIVTAVVSVTGGITGSLISSVSPLVVALVGGGTKNTLASLKVVVTDSTGRVAVRPVGVRVY